VTGIPPATKPIAITARDGTSQAGRSLGALDPGYVSVDERTTEDLVAFAREYGPGLTYYGLDDQPAGDWGAFVDPAKPSAPDAREAFLTKVATFMTEPERFDPSTSPELFRPHFVLFLAFLKLFQKSQAELNALTRRHLEFYYGRFLGMLKKRAIPDRLNLVFDLRKGMNEVKVPAGSRLSAGPDSLGRDRIYTSDRDLVVNRVRIAKLRSLFVERWITGVKEARERGLNDNDLEDAVLGMFQIALGDPQPGDKLPPYPGLGGSPDTPGTPDTLAKLQALDLTQLTSETDAFHLSLFEIRDLMRLEKVAIDFKRQGLPAQMNDQLRKISAVIAVAAQRSSSTPPPAPSPFDPEQLTSYFDAALGKVSPSGGAPRGVEAYWAQIQELETYFFMTAEDFHDVLAQIALQQTPSPDKKPAWDRVDAILDKAHEEKVHDARRRALAAMGYAPNNPKDTKELALVRLIHEVMGSNSATELDLSPFLGQTLTLDDLHAAVAAGDWARVDSILEVVESNRIGVPAAQKEEWLYLFPAADATAVGPRQASAGQPTPAQGARLPWATFGLAPPAVEGVPPAPVLGWAITSPVLELSQGTRDITLTLDFDARDVDPKAQLALGDLLESQPLVFQISTAKGWVTCQPVPVGGKLYKVISGVAPAPFSVQVQLKIEASVDPIAALPTALAEFDSPWPALRLLLRPSWDTNKQRFVAPYRELGNLRVLGAHVTVAVTELKPLQLQNDQATLNPKKPFEPFGSAPGVGARLLIGHPEVLTKKLDSLTFKFEWMGAPANLAAHYANYPPMPDPLSFTTWVSLVDRSVVMDLHGKLPATLFGSNTAAVTSITTAIPPEAKVIDSETIPPGSFTEDVSSWPRYLQWELNAPDFQHEAYPAVASEKAVDLAAAIANKATITSADYKVKPPYTPKLKSLTLDYSSSVDIQLDPASAGARDVRVFHVHPFGSCDIEAERSAAGLPFLPRYDNEGELYLGLSDVSPPQTVSILFQMAEGSADPDLERQPVAWSYLNGDRWIALDDRVLLDTTRGLINTGIVELALEPAAPSARFGDGLYWVRAAVARNTAAVCDTIALHPQAVSATFVDRDNAPDHFKAPLLPSTITKLASPIAGISGVRQPYTSYGGRMAEGEGMWATRVSERLRHKQRALSAWDYERLVLDRFPEIYKAKCIPASPDRPGEVVIIVIPDIRNLMPSDPFEPKAPSKLLADIEDYLAAKVPAFASVKARNPHYVSVRVRLGVRFTGQGNDGYYTRTLNDELNRFLSPWAYEEGADIVIGGKIYANSIVDFADRRPYVDYVAGIELFLSDDGDNFKPAIGGFVEAGPHDAILVAARTHTIDVIHDAVYDENLMRGIGFMKVELDFIVAPDLLPDASQP
jgi:hypothetical protein